MIGLFACVQPVTKAPVEETGAADDTAPVDTDTATADTETGTDATTPPTDGMVTVFQAFDTDPGWVTSNNRSAEQCLEVTQDFGWSASANAGRTTGEIGGRIARSVTPAWYGYPVGSHTWTSRLAVDGHLAMTSAEGEAYLGFFRSTVQGFRPANFIGLRLEGEGDYANAEVSYTTGAWESGGTESPTPVDASTTPHYFLLEYLPDARTISITLDDTVHTYTIPEGVDASPLTVDRFGIMNVQKPGGSQMELWLDDLYLNTDNSSHAFDADPGWDGSGNRVTFTDCVQRGVQDFGWEPSAYAGGTAGELGGLVWRVNPGDAATYIADPTVSVDPSMPLRASGRVSVERAAVDSGVLLGWFRVPADFAEGEYLPGFLGIQVGGPSAVGHYFNALLYDENDQRYMVSEGPVILPDGSDHDWEMVWDPAARTLTVRLDAEEQVYAVPAEYTPSVFDHFGLTVPRPDGQSLEIYFDDIEYTARVAP